MCEPIAIATGIQVASSVVGYVNASEEAKRSRDAAARAEARLNQETTINYNALEARRVEEDFANGQVVQQLERDAGQLTGQTEAAAAASNLSGAALTNLLLDIDRQRATEVEGRYRFQESTQRQIDREERAVALGHQATLDKIRASVKPSPSPLSLLLDVGGSVAGGQLAADQNTPEGVPSTFLGL